MANRIIIPSKIIDTLVRGDRASRFIDIVHREVRRLVDEKAGMLKGVVLFAMGTSRYVEMKKRVTDKIVELLPHHTGRVEEYWRDAMSLETTIYSRLSSLPPADFEEVLHTCFEQDEWLLIAVGAVLGMSAGVLQLLVLMGL